MARTVEEILKAQLGNLMVEIAILNAKNEQLTEENAELKKKLEPQKAKE